MQLTYVFKDKHSFETKVSDCEFFILDILITSSFFSLRQFWIIFIVILTVERFLRFLIYGK